VAVAGGIGALARFRVDSLVSRRWSSFPAGTLVVNASGSFLLGALVGGAAGHDVLLVAGTGLAGGYTTFSTWMFETERLGEDARLLAALVNIVGATVVGLAAAGAGWVLAAALT
jgi:CrcB protein